jgi:hypothetical protein
MLRLIMETNRHWTLVDELSFNDRERNDHRVIHEFVHVRFIVYITELVDRVVNLTS